MKKIIPLFLICLLVVTAAFLVKTPSNFPEKKVVTVDKKLTIDQIGMLLKENHVIQSPLIFKTLIFKRNVKAGEYYFDKEESIFSIVNRLIIGKSNLPMIRITIPEGSNNEQIGAIIWGKVPNFNAPLFLKKGFALQGRLFPDTYDIPLTADEDFVISLLKNTFDKKAGKVSDETVNMAAILEEEGSNAENRKMIANILWRRLKIGMPLQVDVARETYKWKGFPSKPITNPGLQSIQAAQEPTPNSYLYYISDKDGIFHYAKTYDEHLVNIQKYLKK
jgi:UPF0755 protein